MINLSLQSDRDKLEELIEADIDQYCSDFYHSGHRKHLGASTLGEACSRKLFYMFRWVKDIKHEGRIQRIFNVGHEAEPRFIQYLKSIGFKFLEPTEKQFRISGCNGHYGGSLDGKCIAPDRYKISEPLIFLNEFKTNKNSSFALIDIKGVMKEKPKHYAQMCQYGFKEQLKYGLYLAENKNDSTIVVKIVELDWTYGASLERKAEEIIYSKQPPNRISDTPSYFDCKYCDYVDICHHGEDVEKNCRSCKFAQPAAQGQWGCNRFDQIIPEDFVKTGCEYHSSINEF